jgi:hypothetical protein
LNSAVSTRPQLRVGPIARLLVSYLLLSCAVAWGQLEIGKILGSVADASGAGIGRAEVWLVNPLSCRQSQTHANAQGQFEFENVPYGAYLLRVSASGFDSTETHVYVDSNVAASIAVKMEVAGPEASIEVHIRVLRPDQNPRSEIVIDESSIKLTPTVIRRDPLQALVSSTPGWNTENDGLCTFAASMMARFMLWVE